jgi:hypothetical protein
MDTTHVPGLGTPAAHSAAAVSGYMAGHALQPTGHAVGPTTAYSALDPVSRDV